MSSLSQLDAQPLGLKITGEVVLVVCGENLIHLHVDDCIPEWGP